MNEKKILINKHKMANIVTEESFSQFFKKHIFKKWHGYQTLPLC